MDDTVTVRRNITVLTAAQALGGSSAPIVMSLGQPDIFQQIVGKYHGGEAERWGGIGLPQAGTTGAAR